MIPKFITRILPLHAAGILRFHSRLDHLLKIILVSSVWTVLFVLGLLLLLPFTLVLVVVMVCFQSPQVPHGSALLPLSQTRRSIHRMLTFAVAFPCMISGMHTLILHCLFF
jgi:hypothetical protein